MSSTWSCVQRLSPILSPGVQVSRCTGVQVSRCSSALQCDEVTLEPTWIHVCDLTDTILLTLVSFMLWRKSSFSAASFEYMKLCRMWQNIISLSGCLSICPCQSVPLSVCLSSYPLWQILLIGTSNTVAVREVCNIYNVHSYDGALLLQLYVILDSSWPTVTVDGHVTLWKLTATCTSITCIVSLAVFDRLQTVVCDALLSTVMSKLADISAFRSIL